MTHFFRLVYAGFVVLFSGFSIHAQPHDDYTAKIDSLIGMTDVRTFNGVVLITKDKKVKYSRAYGYTNFDKKTSLKLDDQFEIMSNSKQITAALLLHQVEKGTIELQSPIKKYLPYLTMSWADTVTVHQLLNHTHGIVDLEKPLHFKPGSQFMYGNLSYSLLGKIIEYGSKKPYIENANALFKQMKMKHTLCYSGDKISDAVSGHYNRNDTFKVLDSSQIQLASIPANGIVSTAEDLAIWNNKLHHGDLMSAESYKLMISYSVMAQHNVFGKDEIGYGYGIRISDKTMPKYYGHTGLGDGFASVTLYFPESDVTVIVLENQMNDNFNINYYFETEIRKIVMGSNLIRTDK